MTTRIVRGCEPFRFDGGPVGFLLQHGFSGCPASMRPMGEWLAERGATVLGPRLPGHGTSWEDLATTSVESWERELERAFLALAGRCPTVVLVGQSFGAALALHLAAKRPDDVAGVVAVNPYVRDPRLHLTLAARPFTRTARGTGNDIKRPGQDELAYERVPLNVLPGLARFLRTVVRGLPSVRAPLLVFASSEDHVVSPANARLVMRLAGSGRRELVRLGNSYHVATLDFDAEALFERTLRFARSLAGSAPVPPA